MARPAVIVGAALALAACSSPEPVRVEIPVPVRVEPPPDLLEPITPPTGVFVPAGDPRAVVGITDAGRAALVAYVDALRQRLAAWTAWTAWAVVEPAADP